MARPMDALMAKQYTYPKTAGYGGMNRFGRLCWRLGDGRKCFYCIFYFGSVLFLCAYILAASYFLCCSIGERLAPDNGFASLLKGI